MIEKLKSIKINITLSALLSIVVGVMLIAYPETVVTIITRAIALVLIISGVVLFVPQLFEPIKSYLSIIVSILIGMIGLWMFFRPTMMASLLPIAIGVLLVVHSVQDVALGFEAKQNKADNWWSILLMAVLNLILGILCICNAFGLVKITMILIGIMLVYDGVSGIFIVHKVNKSARTVVDSEILREEDLDDYE